MKTPLCETLGIEHPIIQAAIGGASCPRLAAAVSNAGGMGAIALTGWGGKEAAARLAEMKALSNRSFVANVLLSYDVAAEVEAILANPPKVVSFFWGDVAPLAPRVHAAGALVMANVGSVEEAKRAVDGGADIITAQGWEAGGHVRGTTATMALIPQVVDAIDPVPVVAAGGIADGRCLAAALCLGAQAAWIGTRFLAAEEADVHPAYRERVLGAGANDTFYGPVFDEGWEDAPGRVLRNASLEAWEAAGCPPRGQRPGEADVIAVAADGSEVRRYASQTMRSDLTGDPGAGALWAGQGVGLVRRRQPAAEIVAEMAAEAARTLSGLGAHG